VQVPVLQREAERLDEVKVGASGQRGTPDVARIPVDFGLDQNDMQGRHDFARETP
jgi:hypothetical protein